MDGGGRRRTCDRGGASRLLLVRLPVVLEFAGGDVLSGAPVGLGDIVLEVVGPDAPDAAAADLDGATLTAPDQ